MKDESARDKAMDKLVAKQLRAGLKPGGASCPNPEILAAYVERTLAPRERASCETHLAGCLGCQALVAELVRLSEDEEPAGIQTAAASSARAATSPRFRWAWAGSALAAVLVVGLWYTGEFRNFLQQTPETSRKIQTSPANKPATPSPVATEEDSKGPLPSTLESRGAPKGQPAEKKPLDAEGRTEKSAAKTEGLLREQSTSGGLASNSVHRETAAQNEYKVTTPAPPVRASDRVAPSQNGVIATPSERAALAKDGRGQGGVIGRSTAQGVAGGNSGATSNNPSANRSAGNLSMAGRSARVISPPSAPKATNEVANSKKSDLRDEEKAKEQAPNTTAQSTDLSENDRDKQQVPQSATQSVMVSEAAQQLEIQAEPSTPQWRVGRHGLIQKRNENGKWRKMESGVKARLNDIAFSSSDEGWTVGQEGTILRTTDGGATWSKLPSPTAEDLVHVTAVSDQAASVVTRGGQTFTTTDGGKTWKAPGR